MSLHQAKGSWDVDEIRIEIKTKGGGGSTAVFVRKSKIEDLMGDSGSLGELLRGLVRPTPEPPSTRGKGDR